jgi:hypothetical protein
MGPFFRLFQHSTLISRSPDLARMAARRECHLHRTRIEPQQYSQGSPGDFPLTFSHRTAESAPLSLPSSLLLDRSCACAPLPRGPSDFIAVTPPSAFTPLAPYPSLSLVHSPVTIALHRRTVALPQAQHSPGATPEPWL